jgi:hypothetical protein
MAYNIRPLSFAEVLDRSFRILVDNAVVLIGISVIPLIPEKMLESFGRCGPIAAMILLMIVGPLLHAALTTAITEIYLDKPVTIESAYRSGWSILFPFFGTYLLLFGTFLLGIIVIAVVAGVSTLAGVTNIVPLLFALGFLVGLPLWIYVVTRWSLIGPVMIVERRFGLLALRRSRDLVEGVWWRTFGIIIVASLIAQVPAGTLNLLWSSIPVIGVLLTGLVYAAGTSYSAIVIAVYYFDRRCRIEDFDLRRLAEQIRSQGAHGSPAATGASSLA